MSQLGRMVYLAYMQGPNAADEVKIMFEIWKSHQNLKHSTATARQKLNRSYGMKCTLSCLKIFVEVPNSLWKAVQRGCFFDSGTVHSRRTPSGVHTESKWSPPGVHVEVDFVTWDFFKVRNKMQHEE